MPKAKCSCGALLKIPDDQEKFRCPQCGKTLTLPPRPAGGTTEGRVRREPPAGPIDFDPPAGEVQIERPAPPPEIVVKTQPRMSNQPFTPKGSAPKGPPAPTPTGAPEPVGPELPEHLRWSRARAWSRAGLAVSGVLLALPLVPVGGQQPALDAWNAAGWDLGHATPATLSVLLAPLGGVIALVAATLPLRRLRGAIVLGAGLLAALPLAFALATADLAAAAPGLPLAGMVPAGLAPFALLAGVALAALATGIAQVRVHATQPMSLRAAGTIAGIALLAILAMPIAADHPRLLDPATWPDLALAPTDPLALYPMLPAGAVDGARNHLVYVHAVALGGVILAGVLSLLSAIPNRWLALATAMCGKLALLAIPVWLAVLSAPAWGSEPESILRGAQGLISRLSPGLAPLFLLWTGARDMLAEGVHAEAMTFADHGSGHLLYTDAPR